MKVVLDTNVLLSGLMLPESLPGRIVAAWRAASFTLVLSEPMLQEIRRVLAYPKISRRIGWDDQTMDTFVLMLRLHAESVAIEGVQAHVPSDPMDNTILATLIASEADVLVTGDGDLLELRDQYPIVTAAEFAKRL